MAVIVTFDKPYTWEGKEYKEVDLSGMETMTVQDMVDVQKKLSGDTAAILMMETTTIFAQEMAVKASGKPVEFFKLMPRSKIRQIQAAIVGQLNADQNKEQLQDHILKFEKAYTYTGAGKPNIAGETFEQVDLSGVGELNTMSETAAENRLAAAGFAPVQTGRNYLYCAIIASMGTGYPTDFFTGLPICEALKLRNAVDAGFFE